MKKFFAPTLCVAALAMASPASAVLDTIDAVPGATLLIPYFAVDANDPNGLTTLFSVNNASATAVLAHVTVWTDQSVPTLDFDIYLTGYDVQTVNVRDILINGNLPRTASDGQDPSDTISPQGPLSQDINFASCGGTLPYVNPGISSGFLAHLQAWHTGNQSPVTGNCAGQDLGDGILRGYITIDTTNQCSLLFPADTGYFGPGGTGIATNQNVLWGDWFLVDATNNFAEGFSAVHVEADRTGQAYGPGDYTFYGRYVAWAGIDGREPLATSFAARYATGGAFDGTAYTVWRDSKTTPVAYNCALAGPSWYPLGAEQVVIFDEEERIFEPSGCPSGDPTCTPDGVLIPAEANRIAVGGELYPLPPGFEFGWSYLNLNTTVVGQVAGQTDPAAAQAWVSWSLTAEGRFAVGLDAIQLDNASNANHTLLPIGD
jgi:hypothetical protein